MNPPSSHFVYPFLVPMSVQLTPPIPDGLDSRIHEWMSSLPNNLSRHQRLPSDAIGRSDSPLLGFAHQESASHDPLHRPSPNYIRRLPEEVTLTNKRSFQDKLLPLPSKEARLPSPVPEDGEQDLSFPDFPSPPMTRDFPPANLARYKTRSSLPPIRRPIARQPSLPVFGTTIHSCHISDHPRIRSHSTATPVRTEFHIQSPILPMLHTTASATPVMPTATVSSQLERQKLDALVIASGLADEEQLQVEGLGLHSSSSQVYLGDPESQGFSTPVEHRSSHDSDTITTTYQSQTVSSPRTSTSLEDLDEFDEDASYYGKEINTLFSPYSRPPSISGPAGAEIVEPAASKWSLSSSIQIDLEKSRRSSPTKSLKNRKDKIKSFISRFTPNSPPPTTDKHISIVSGISPQKRLLRERSYSDVRVSFTSRGSVSSQMQGVTYGSWESVPPTPTTAVSSMSVSTGYSPVTPSDNESDPRDAFHVSEEKLPGGAGLSRVDSSVFARDTSSFISGTDTSVPTSPVDAVPPQLPLKHAVSTASLKINGFKGLASRIGLAPTENSYEERVNEMQKASPLVSQAQPPRSFKERMMLKNNGSALSLILGMGNKSSKSKRKLLISGVEKGDRRKYEAISNWCEGFGQVIVKQVENGAIVADFRDASVAESVCRLQARVYITGAGSVSLSWTTKEISKLNASV